MSEPIIPQNQDEEQNPQVIEGEEIAPEDLEDVAGGGGDNGCTNIFCAND